MAKKGQATEATESKLAVNKVMALKGKALETKGSLWLKLGKSKLELPASVHILESDGDVFVSFKGGSGIYRVNEDSKKLATHSDPDEAYKKLLKVGKPGKAEKKSQEIPQDVLEALMAAHKAAQAAGFKLGYDPKTGQVKAVKPRAKRGGGKAGGGVGTDGGRRKGTSDGAG